MRGGCTLHMKLEQLANEGEIVLKGYEEEEPYQVEETKYMNEQRNYHFKPNPILPTHYSPALRNHESFSYGGKSQQGTRYEQNHHQSYTRPRFQQQQQHQQ